MLAQPQNNEIANLFAQLFISRTDVQARQTPDGAWHPVYEKYTRSNLIDHIEGKYTVGHYLLNQNSQCKLFVFDIDLAKTGKLPATPLDVWASDAEYEDWESKLVETDDLRAAWLDRSHPARTYMKHQFRELSHRLCQAIHTELQIPCAVSYSGNKGVHVYGFTGLISAEEAREGAAIVLDTLGDFEPIRGESFFAHKKFPNLTVEVYPKQGSLDGKKLGNLVSLPLGKNQKSSDPKFFVDLTAAITELRPVDPVWALTTTDPWRRPGE